MCTKDFHIVVTDRNPHVRGLLFRELLREGYRVTEARDGKHLLEILNAPDAVHILILDPEMRGIRWSTLTEGSLIHTQGIRVVFHALAEAEIPAGLSPLTDAGVFVDKTGDLDQLKHVLERIATAMRTRDTRGRDNV